jgi:hypothetical protein
MEVATGAPDIADSSFRGSVPSGRFHLTSLSSLPQPSRAVAMPLSATDGRMRKTIRPSISVPSRWTRQPRIRPRSALHGAPFNGGTPPRTIGALCGLSNSPLRESATRNYGRVTQTLIDRVPFQADLARFFDQHLAQSSSSAAGSASVVRGDAMITISRDGVWRAVLAVLVVAIGSFIAGWATLAIAQQIPTLEQLEAPFWNMGDTWRYITIASPKDQQLKRPRFEWSRKVDSVDEDFRVKRTGTDSDDAAISYSRFTRSLRMTQKVGNQTNYFQPISFPLKPGKKWDTKSVGVRSAGDTLETTLSCEAGEIAKVKVPAGEFDAVPIACNGRWKNLSSGSADQARYVYWYAPAVGWLVKTEVETWFDGREFAKWTEELTAYQPGS